MTETVPNNLPPYSFNDPTDPNNEAPPPYQAISPHLLPASFNNQPPSPPPFPHPPPPFGYHIPPPSYSHSNNFPPHLDGRVSGLVLVDGLNPPDNEEEPERENSSTVLLYTLAVLTCMVCGFFAGLLFIVLILLGEKRSAMPMGKRRKYFLFVSLVVSMLSFFFAFVVISWFGYFLKPMPFGGCRYGISNNRTCCPLMLPPSMCQHGVMRKNDNGCRSCCTSEACQAEWRNAHCSTCVEHSTKLDSKGCYECCREMQCGSRGVYRNSFNCSTCCPPLDATSCLATPMHEVVVAASGCKTCCANCPHRPSLLSDRKGCPLCCAETDCQNAYTDKDGCKKCCDSEQMSRCQDSSVGIDDGHMCGQCCAGGAANICAPKNHSSV